MQFSGKHSFWYKLLHHRTALISLAVVALYVAAAVGVEVYSIVCEYNHITPAYAVENALNAFAPPSAEHWLGTDYLGRDCLLRAVGGISTAVKVGVIASLLAALIGVTLGMLSGFYGGRLDSVISWFYSTFAAMPTLLFILAFYSGFCAAFHQRLSGAGADRAFAGVCNDAAY